MFHQIPRHTRTRLSTGHMVAGTPSGPTASALASSMRALYPSSADATAVSLPTALISAERLPPPNPMLQKEYAKIGGAAEPTAERDTIREEQGGVEESRGVGRCSGGARGGGELKQGRRAGGGGQPGGGGVGGKHDEPELADVKI
jgi:hypothetical protein